MNISGNTRLVGVIGHPIAHSLSPRMHNAAFAADSLDYVYVAMDVPPEKLGPAVKGLSALGFVGFNVTMPHKEKIIPLMDDLDEPARLSGAVNTVSIRGDGLFGMNTDGSGFIEACLESGVEFAGKRVLLLGAGGAAASIAAAVLDQNVRRLVIANRTIGRAEDVRENISNAGKEAKVTVIPLGDAAEEAAEADVIVNTTYLGMKNCGNVPIPTECLGAGKAVCDAVYLQGEDTDLILRARETGATTVPGGRMLLYQGVQAQRVWTGRNPNVEVMNDAVVR